MTILIHFDQFKYKITNIWIEIIDYKHFFSYLSYISPCFFSKYLGSAIILFNFHWTRSPVTLQSQIPTADIWSRFYPSLYRSLSIILHTYSNQFNDQSSIPVSLTSCLLSKRLLYRHYIWYPLYQFIILSSIVTSLVHPAFSSLIH